MPVVQIFSFRFEKGSSKIILPALSDKILESLELSQSKLSCVGFLILLWKFDFFLSTPNPIHFMLNPTYFAPNSTYFVPKSIQPTLLGFPIRIILCRIFNPGMGKADFFYLSVMGQNSNAFVQTIQPHPPVIPQNPLPKNCDL